MKSLCVLIPAYNERLGIRRTIISCLNAGIKRDDIYVIDDGSKDDTSAVANHYRVQVLTKPNGGKANAIVVGVEHYKLVDRYEWISILDADCTVETNYFEEILKAAARHPDATLIGGGQRAQQANWLTAYRAVEQAFFDGVHREAQHFMGASLVVPGFCSNFKATSFRTLDFTRHSLVEDMDWTVQIQRRGERVVFAPDAIVHTQHPLTIRNMVGQVSRWYRGTWQIVRQQRLGRGWQKIDAVAMVMVFEMMLMGLVVIALPFLFMRWPTYTGFAVLADLSFLSLMALMVAIKERHAPIFFWSPFYIIPRSINYAVFVWSFFAEMRSHETKWFSPERY